MAKKKRNSGEDDIDSYRHEAETRKNAVPVGLASYDTSKPKPKKYDYDPHLDPQLYMTTYIIAHSLRSVSLGLLHV